MAVSPLSRRGMLRRLRSTPIPHDSMACAFSLLPCPLVQGLPLRFAVPSGDVRGCHVPVSVTTEGRRALSTGSVIAHDTAGKTPCTRDSALLAQASQHLWRVFCDEVSRAFPWGRHAIHPRPVSVSVLTETSSPRGSDASRLTVGTLVGGAVRVVTFPPLSGGYR